MKNFMYLFKGSLMMMLLMGMVILTANDALAQSKKAIDLSKIKLDRPANTHIQKKALMGKKAIQVQPKRAFTKSISRSKVSTQKKNVEMAAFKNKVELTSLPNGIKRMIIQNPALARQVISGNSSKLRGKDIETVKSLLDSK